MDVTADIGKAIGHNVVGIGAETQALEGKRVEAGPVGARKRPPVDAPNLRHAVEVPGKQLRHALPLLRRQDRQVNAVHAVVQVGVNAGKVVGQHRAAFNSVCLLIPLCQFDIGDRRVLHQQIHPLPLPVRRADFNGGHFFEPDPSVPLLLFWPDLPQEVVQLILVPDVVFRHQLGVVTEQFQCGELHVLVLCQIQCLQQGIVLPLSDGVVAESVPLVPQNIIAGAEPVLVGAHLNGQGRVVLQTHRLQNLPVQMEELVHAGQLPAIGAHGVIGQLRAAFQNPHAVYGHILLCKPPAPPCAGGKPGHFRPPGDPESASGPSWAALFPDSDRFPPARRRPDGTPPWKNHSD